MQEKLENKKLPCNENKHGPDQVGLWMNPQHSFLWPIWRNAIGCLGQSLEPHQHGSPKGKIVFHWHFALNWNTIKCIVKVSFPYKPTFKIGLNLNLLFQHFNELGQEAHAVHMVRGLHEPLEQQDQKSTGMTNLTWNPFKKCVSSQNLQGPS